MLRAAIRIGAGVTLVFACVLLIGAALGWVSPLAASIFGGLYAADSRASPSRKTSLIRSESGWAPAILMARRREEEDVTELRMGSRG